MKRTFERLLFMVIGAFIAFFAYLVGNMDSSVNANDTKMKQLTVEDLNVTSRIFVGDVLNKSDGHTYIDHDGIRITKGDISIPDSKIELTSEKNIPHLTIRDRHKDKTYEVSISRPGLNLFQFGEKPDDLSAVFLTLSDKKGGNKAQITLSDQHGKKSIETE